MGTISTYRGDIQGLRARIGAVQSLAFLAIFLHIAVPFALQLAGPATEGLFQTIICSGGEAKAVYLDAEGNPVEPAAPGTSSHDCTSCLHHCGAAALTAILEVHAGVGLRPPAQLTWSLHRSSPPTGILARRLSDLTFLPHHFR